MLTISSASTEYIRIPVAVTADTGLALDPTSDVVAIGFSSTNAVPASFSTATWTTDTSGATPVYKARALVTAGSLDPGVWTAYVKITDSPEVPVIQAGTLNVI